MAVDDIASLVRRNRNSNGHPIPIYFQSKRPWPSGRSEPRGTAGHQFISGRFVGSDSKFWTAAAPFAYENRLFHSSSSGNHHSVDSVVHTIGELVRVAPLHLGGGRGCRDAGRSITLAGGPTRNAQNARRSFCSG